MLNNYFNKQKYLLSSEVVRLRPGRSKSMAVNKKLVELEKIHRAIEDGTAGPTEENAFKKLFLGRLGSHITVKMNPIEEEKKEEDVKTPAGPSNVEDSGLKRHFKTQREGGPRHLSFDKTGIEIDIDDSQVSHEAFLPDYNGNNFLSNLENEQADTERGGLGLRLRPGKKSYN